MGKSSSAPQSPDPGFVIPLQAQYNSQAFNQAVNASRVNQYGPTGSQTWERSPDTFDQAGYDEAYRKWDALYPDGRIAGESDPQGSDGRGVGAAPDRSLFTTGGTWSQRNNLSANQQQLFDANENSQLQQAQLLQALTGRLSSTLGSSPDYSSAPGAVNSIGSTQLNTGDVRMPNQQLLESDNSLSNPTYGDINRGELSSGGDPNAYGRYNVNTGQMIGAPDPTGRVATPGAQISDRSQSLEALLSGYRDSIGGLDPLAFNKEAADAVYGQATRYLDPQVQQNQQALEARLSEQGFVPGTPGYQRAMQNFQDTNNRAYADARDRATTQGTSVGRDAYGSSLSGIQSQIAAALQGSNFGLSNDQARSNEGLNLANFTSGQNAQDFNQRLTGAAFNSNEQQQQFNRDMSGANLGMQQDTADFSRRNDAARLANNNQAQDFGQQQYLSEQQRQSGLDANSVAQQLFQNRGTTAAFNNNANQQQFTNERGEIDRSNAALMAQQNANITSGNFQNDARQRAIAELLQQRSQPINELNAIRSGTQLSPNGFGSGQASAPGVNSPDAQGAFNQQYQGQLGAYNAQVGSDNATTQGLSSLAMAAAMYFSDARLKDNIRQIGKTPGGHNLYEYEMFGRTEQGVLAQEMLSERPEAVSVDPDTGYYLVDYSQVD